MNIQDIDFSGILIKCRDNVEFFKIITSKLLDYEYDIKSDKVQSRPSSIQLALAGMYVDTTRNKLVSIQINSLYYKGMMDITGAWSPAAYRQILIDLNDYRGTLKGLIQYAEEYYAIKLYLNMVYGMLNRLSPDLYISDYHHSDFNQDVSRRADDIVFRIASCMEGSSTLYIDTDEIVLYVKNISDFVDKVHTITTDVIITPLSRVAVVGKHKILAIDAHNNYHRI
jgi:hypothetical protein